MRVNFRDVHKNPVQHTLPVSRTRASLITEPACWVITIDRAKSSSRVIPSRIQMISSPCTKLSGSNVRIAA